MVRLSVNVNKVATLRNSRGGSVPSVLQAVRVCVEAGVPGITVHPRADERHIRSGDVREIAKELAARPDVEFNIEGDPRPDLISLVQEVRPQQCTLVPVKPGEVTSQAGWSPDTPPDAMVEIISRLHDHG
ncbi:MAG: pyridoxine 5'-phosphate synthase, partial [Vicinamibacterales bacterium]